MLKITGLHEETHIYLPLVLSSDGKTGFGSNNSGPKKIFAFDTTTGKKKWEFVTGWEKLRFSPAISPDGKTVFIGSGYKKLYAVDSATGKKKWEFEIQEEISGDFMQKPICSLDGKMVFVGGNYYLFAFDGATGEEKWRFEGLSPQVNVLPDGEHLLIVGYTGYAEIISLDYRTRKTARNLPTGEFLAGTDLFQQVLTKTGEWANFWEGEIESLQKLAAERPGRVLDRESMPYEILKGEVVYGKNYPISSFLNSLYVYSVGAWDNERWEDASSVIFFPFVEDEAILFFVYNNRRISKKYILKRISEEGNTEKRYDRENRIVYEYISPSGEGVYRRKQFNIFSIFSWRNEYGCWGHSL